ncbi:STAS domain-containing protein [Nocardia halotolerans]|uniref:STAS domain-containing protein n=1 Tax=Nocardia halotolerans TaxID=1755878 RepID=A0ABV8VMS7_9NOCA
MTTHSSHAERQPLPAFDGESPDVCARLRAELESRPTAVVLRVHGDIDAYTLTRWGHVLDDAFHRATSSGHLVVDVSEVAFISCRSILDLAGRAQQHHGTTCVSVVHAAPSVVDRIVDAAGLTQWLRLHTDADAAIGTGPALRLRSHHDSGRGTPTHL